MIQKHTSIELSDQIASAASEKGVKLPRTEVVWYPKISEVKNHGLSATVATCEKHHRFGVKAWDVAELGELIGWNLPLIFGGYPDDIAALLKEGDSEVEFRGKVLLHLINKGTIK